MKKNILLVFVFIITTLSSLSAQKSNSIFIDSIGFSTNLKLYKGNIINQSLLNALEESKISYPSLTIDLDYINKPFFQVFNNVSSLNDVYDNKNGNYIYTKSILIPENLNRRHKIDSFNPLGFTNDGKSVLFGSLNLILDKL